ncbi:MAG: hypothetical protein DI598_09955 [Pseudopedobacter saltans]|uniref:Uncharacterized protein n=1 Tax=Pseudopedobacter saltans TaxID=151895 RepID=A0A2W5GRL3_9SPHI|nr:MAG: hypothetical protein DI598_09955 [Pseudopedobacter saltans]
MIEEALYNKFDDALIYRFFSGTCSEEERELLLNYLEKYPNVLDEYFDNGFEENTVQEKDVPIGHLDILSEIHDRIDSKRRKRKLLLTSAGILSLIGLLFMGFQLFYQPDEKNYIVQSDQPIIEIRQTNTTKETKELILPDKSIAVLYPGSTIQYRKEFKGAQRNIQLDGEADFQVEKDSTKPFVVIANHIATKALGTRFKVKINLKDVLVKLFEGKVVVWRNDQKDGKKYFIYPNYQLKYFFKDNSFLTSRFKKNITVSDNIVKSNPIKKAAPEPTIAFKNIPLQSVLEQLATLYHIQIEYSAPEISDIYIIGDLPGEQSAELLLRNIARMNGLQFVKKSETTFSLYR